VKTVADNFGMVACSIRGQVEGFFHRLRMA
jgi:hypothetical protein